MEKGFQLRNYHVRRGIRPKDSTPLYPVTKAEYIIGDVSGVTKVTSLPETGEAGKIYYNTTDNKYYLYDGTSYSPIDSTGAGKSAYDVAVDEGFDGDEAAWLASLKGDKGNTGPQGPAGPAGPQGNSGYTGAAGELEVVNNLTEGGPTKALSAEMGKEIGEKMVFLEDTDKVSVAKTLDDAFVSKLLNEDDYTKTTGYYIDRNNGNPVSSSGHAYIRIDAENFRGSKLYMKGINNNIGYAFGWASFNSEGTRTGGTYYGAPSSNQSYTLTINSSVAYYLLSIGKSPDNFKAIWDLDYIPTSYERGFDVVSVNDGQRVIASEIAGLSTADNERINAGLFEKLNKIDLRKVVSGYTIYVTSEVLQVKQSASSSVLMQEIPESASTVSVYGIKGVGTYGYCGWAIINGSGQVLTSTKFYGASSRWTSLSVPAVDGKKYIVLNVVGESALPYSTDELIILYNPYQLTYDSQWYINNANVITMKHSVEYETLPENLISKENFVSYDTGNKRYWFEFQTNGDGYLVWYCPNGRDVNVANTFIQYDSNGDTITSENVYSVSNRLNFGNGNSGSICSMIKLQSGCAKVKIAMNFSPSEDLSIRSIVANGNRMFLTGNRQVYWRKPRVTSIDGIVINHTYKNPLEGLTICCLGDSITDFGNGSLTYKYGYPAYIQSRFDCACINYGRGNARFIDQSNTDYTMNTDPGTPSSGTTGYNNNKVSTQVRWMLREMQEDGITPNVVILSGGTNDCFSDVSYGSLETAMASYGNTTDAVKTTFYDAAVYMVSKIRAAFPNVKIFFGTPINSLNSGQAARLPAWRDAMIAAAKAMCCGVIDWYAESGVVNYPTSNNPCFNTNDLIHPSVLGINGMAKLAVSEISKAFPR